MNGCTPEQFQAELRRRRVNKYGDKPDADLTRLAHEAMVRGFASVKPEDMDDD